VSKFSRVMYVQKWDPYANWGPPAQGWFHFYLRFELCWVNWLLAGLCTQAKCCVGIHGSIFDVTDFLSLHPGSPEVMDFSGCDSTRGLCLLCQLFADD
jgi:hypothetical protein